MYQLCWISIGTAHSKDLLGDFRSLGLFFPYPFYEFWIWIYMVLSFGDPQNDRSNDD